MQTCTATTELSVEIPQKARLARSYSSTIPLLGVIQRTLYPTTETLDHPCSVLIYVQYSGSEDSSEVHTLMSSIITVWYIYTMEHHFTTKNKNEIMDVAGK